MLTHPSRDDSRGYGDFIRLEQLLEAISDSVDQDLSILDFVDGFEEPNALHGFLTREASVGHILITTNFDCLLEKSIEGTGRRARTMISGREFRQWRAFLASADIPVFKLHGSYHRYSRGSKRFTPASIQATISRIARGANEFSLATEKSDFLRHVLLDRELWVVGYSGTDDLDVMPTLNQIAIKKVTWILHNAGAVEDVTDKAIREAHGKDPVDRTGFDRFLVDSVAVRAGLVRVIRGPTRTALNRELGAGLSTDLVPTGEGYDRVFRHFLGWRERYIPRASYGHLIFGDLLLRTSRLHQAEVHIKRAWRDKRISPAIRVRLAAMASKVHLRRGNPVLARRWARKAVDQLLPGCPIEERVHAHHQLGYSCYKCGEPHLAEIAYEEAASLARVHSRVAWEGVINHDTALVLQDRWAIADATRLYRASFRQSMAVGDVQHVSWTLYQLAVCNFEMARLGIAEHYLTRSAALAQQIGDWNHMSLIEQERGMFDLATGQLASAVKRFRKSGRIDRTTGIREFDGLDLFQQGVVFLEAHRHETALRLFNDAFIALRKIGDQEIVAELRSYQAQAELERGNGVAARSRARSAKALAETVNAPAYRLRAEYILALTRVIDGSTQHEKLLAALIQQAFDRGMRMLALDMVSMPSRLRGAISEVLRCSRRRRWAMSVYRRWGNHHRLRLLTHR